MTGKLLRIIALLIAVGSPIFAQAPPEKLELAGYHYKEVVENADSNARHLPLVIAIHWMGSTPAEFANDIIGFKKPVRILLVEGRYPYSNGFSFFPVEPKDYYELPADDKMAILLDEAERMSKFVEAVTKRYAPKKKPVIIGASQGGDLSYVVAIRHGQLISHSFPLLATMDDRIVGDKAKGKKVPIDVFHGTADPIVPIDTVNRHVKTLQGAGFKVKLHTYNGIKHDIPSEMKADFQREISRVLS